MTVALGLGLLVLAAVLLGGGAELFAEHAAAAGRRLGVTGLAIGLLLAGAEPEELVTAVLAAARDQDGIAVGDAIGANVTMITLTLGAAAALVVLPLSTRIRNYAVAAAAAGGLAVAALSDDQLSATEGIGLLAAYVVLVAVVWWRERTVPLFGEVAEALEDDDDEPAGRGLFLALIGIALMGAGGWSAVSGAERLVSALAVEGSVVGLTLVALATTSEFLALVPAAVRRGIPELAVAGIIGSVAYNATVTLGAAALVGATDARQVLTPSIIAVAGTAVVAVAASATARLPRMLGVGLVVAYIGFVWLTWR